MRRKVCFPLCAFAVLLTLSGCVGTQKKQSEADTLRLYYPAALSEVQGGDAIDSVGIARGTLGGSDQTAQARTVLALLLGECREESFRSPMPKGTSLLSCEVRGSTAYVDFSAAYGQLSGIELTLADYCVTLSLTQIKGIYAVRITVMGQDLAYRDTSLFMASDVLLSSTEDVVRTLTVRLWFPDADGVLTPEERILPLYEGESRVGVIVNALLAGPDGAALQPLVPKDFSVLSVRVDNGICYLNLPRHAAELLSEGGDVPIEGFVRSLCELEDVDEVWLFVDGEWEESYLPK